MNSQMSNPYSTGGGGTTFEQLVGMTYLVSLLAGDMARGLDEGICDQVSFQKRWSDALLDDIVITTRSSNAKTRKLMLQVKHKLSISNSKANHVFQRVMSDCWETFVGHRGSFNPATDRLGIAVGVYHASVDMHLQSLLQWARTSHSLEDFGRIKVRGSASDGMRDYLAIFSKTLERVANRTISEEEVWQFLRCFVYMYFDIEYEGSSSANYVKNRALEQLTVQDTREATKLLVSLQSLVSEYARSGGGLDSVTLRQRLSNFGLKDRSDCSHDLERLRRISDRTLGRITETIGQRLQIPRTELVSNTIKTIASNPVVIITGEPGTGKSVLLKKIAEQLRQEGEILAISVDDLSGANFEEFASNLRLEHDFQLILSAFKSAPIRCLFVDGLEQILHDNQRRKVLYDLIHAIQTYNGAIPDIESDSKWRLVATCRLEQYIEVRISLRNSLDLKGDNKVLVPPLDSTDLEAIRDEFPALRHLTTQQHIQEIIRTPFVLDFLTFPELQLVDLPKTELLTETWLIELYWGQVVRNSEKIDQHSGDPELRERSIITLGKLRLRNGRQSVNASEVDAEVIGPLVRDKVIRSEEGRISFAHETLDDWTVSRILLGYWDELPTFIKEFEQSLGLLKPMRLLALRELELKQSPDRWLKLLGMLESHTELAAGLRQTVLLAPLSSPLLDQILKIIEPLLFNNEGRLLGDFVRALRTFHTVPSQAMLQLLRGTNLRKSEVDKLLAHSREPVAEPWVPVWNLLIRKSDLLPRQALSEIATAAMLWMKSREMPLRKEVGQLCSAVLNREFHVQREDDIARTYDPAISKKVTISRELARHFHEAILHGADCIPETVSNLLHDLFEADEDDLADLLFGRNSASNWFPVAKYMPETFAEITLKLFCDASDSNADSYGESLLDWRNWRFRLKHDYIWKFPLEYQSESPFYGFLKFDYLLGIKLITGIVNCATKKWTEETRIIRNARPLPQKIRLPAGNRELWGDHAVYNWLYGLSTNTTALALISLHNWLTEHLQNEGPEEVGRMFDLVLSQSDSVALVALCVAVAQEDIHSRAAYLISVLANPAFWVLDQKNYGPLGDFSTVSGFRNMLTVILFTGQSEARETLTAAMRRFPENVPVFYEEELENDELITMRREYMEQLAALAISENYTLDKQGDKILVQFKNPAEIASRRKQQDDALEISLRSARLTELALSIDSNRQADESTLLQALESAMENQNNLQRLSEKELGAVAELCAALVRQHPDWLKKNGYWQWCRQKLFEAVRFHDDESGSPHPTLGITHLVAQALPSLVKNNPEDVEARELIWYLIVTAQPFPSYDAVSKLFTAIDILWDITPDFVWQTYNLVAARADFLARYGSHLTLTDQAAEEDRVLLRAQAPRISQQDIRCAYWLPPLVAAFPRLSKRPQSGVDLLCLDFIDEVVLFNNKVHRDKREEHQHFHHQFLVPVEWEESASQLLADWVLHMEFGLACERILEPTLQAWSESPGALGSLLQEIIMIVESRNQKERVVALWKHIYDRFWPMQSSQDSHQEMRGSERRNVYSALIFMPKFGIYDPWKKRGWNPASELVAEFCLWVEKLAHQPDYWPILVRMLSTIGKVINVPHGVNWVVEVLQQPGNPDLLLSDKRNMSALSELLIDIWHENSAIKSDHLVFQRFVHVVDLLASRGDQIAVELQRKIEF